MMKSDDKMEKVKLAAAKSALKALKADDASKFSDALSVFFSACSEPEDEEPEDEEQEDEEDLSEY